MTFHTQNYCRTLPSTRSLGTLFATLHYCTRFLSPNPFQNPRDCCEHFLNALHKHFHRKTEIIPGRMERTSVICLDWWQSSFRLSERYSIKFSGCECGKTHAHLSEWRDQSGRMVLWDDGWYSLSRHGFDDFSVTEEPV